MADDIVINHNIRIPVSELQFRFATSSGPGGQHVNKAETKVTLLFDVVHSPSLDDAARVLITKRLASRIDKDGVLQISVQESRSQHRNRETAVSRFQSLLAAALKPRKRRRPTRPSKAANERRLAKKKKQGERKRDRSRDWRSFR